jgi:hypothetical protein
LHAAPEEALPQSSKIHVMISSRCNDSFPLGSKGGTRLSEIRLKLKKELENAAPLGKKIYEVWINEDATASAELDSWDECMRQAAECDIFIVLYNGNAGWPGTGENASVGICHAEFLTAYSGSPAKVAIVDIFERGSPAAPSSKQDMAFQARMDRENRFQPRAKDEPSLADSVRKAVTSMTVRLVQRGVMAAGRGRGYLGPALEWNRMSYTERGRQMISAVRAALGANDKAKERGFCVAKIEDQSILFRVGAVPDSMSVSAAREMVGQPHLSDHASATELARVDGGPVHIIACHKGVTSAQAQRMLGFPNATVVAAPFGIYVVDPVQAVQLVLIADCADEHATRLGVQRFFEWLPQSQQSALLVRSAKKRKELVAVMAAEL